jgi:hypothetical protein
MPHRTFRDSQDRLWDVWSVKPMRIERRIRVGLPPGEEGRHRNEPRMPVGVKWVDGWLAFEADDEKRRLAPIPPDWVELDDAGLEALCKAATAIRHRRRRLIE